MRARAPSGIVPASTAHACDAPGRLGLVPIEDALGPVELARHVLGVVMDGPAGAAQRVVGDVRPQHARLDGRLDAVPDLLAVTSRSNANATRS